jgi:maleate isomerase
MARWLSPISITATGFAPACWFHQANSVAEPEIRAMLPRGTSMLVTRLALLGSSKPELMRMLDRLEAASELLADAKVDVIVFHCTAVSTFAPELAHSIRERIRSASGIKCFTTADAILHVLTHVNAKRISLLTPYIDDVHDREIAFFEANGFQLNGAANLGSTPIPRWLR